MKSAALDTILAQYRRLLTPTGRTTLNRIIVLSGVEGVLEALALSCALLGSAALATGLPAFGLGVAQWVVLLLVLAAAGFGVAALAAGASYRTAFDIMRNCHTVVGDAIAGLPLGWFGTVEAGRYSRALTSGMMQMGQALAHMLSRLVSRASAVVILTIGVLLWQPFLGLILALAIPAYALVSWGAAALAQRAKRRAEPSKDALAQRIVEYAGCQGALRSSGRSLNPPHLEEAVRAEAKASMRLLLVDSGLLLVAGMFSQLVVVVMIVLAAQRAVNGDLGAVETVVFIGVLLRLVHSLTQVGEMMVALQDQTPTLESIAEVLDAPTMPEPVCSAPVADTSVELVGVGFGYQPGRPVLRDVSFRVAPRTMTALVGPSGSGKTTIARLISRFHDVDTGSVRIGGADVRDLRIAGLMSLLSLVFQDVYLFDDTLEANVRVGCPNATDAEVRRVADIAGVTEIVRRLPHGWATRVGEGGRRLSGGERQRVAIARALLKRAPIVIVDEATSALDAENEANIQQALEHLREQATVLVIAHRLNTIRNADQIVVLDSDGSVAQVGVHDDLVAQPGIYQGFWRQREASAGWALV